MQKYNVARFGMIAGWLTLAGILTFSVIGPNIIAGQRVSGTFDSAAIKAYYSHDGLAPFSACEFFVILAFLPFATALRKVLAAGERADYFSLTGYAFALVAAGLYIADQSLQITLAGIAKNGGDIVPTFRFWDILYNSGSYIAEAGYAAFFSLAMRDVSRFPRWMPAFGVIVGLLQLINASALYLGIPDNYTLVGNLAFMAWFIGTNIGLGRLAKDWS